ncbi:MULTISPECIES: hypothetical protein [Streptomyces]|uniref:hypothetical protein n=1 Tax=Streptomyces TaxID=1883 RepID=UPI00196665A4|nr:MULTISPECIES: hypothetical protein [Streptomyces]QRX96638.1 hypothetical protein JNO44_00020 [Streptomyces noursei]UJB47110.1 hypothetical protein HRD51_40950 [Streptomyces sp. A1-5]
MRPWNTSAQKNLRRLLNEWDPIGVADAVQDEYDCMIGPLFRRLHGGADQAEIGEFLRHELEAHFGLPSSQPPEAVATRLIAWWTATDPADDADSR